MKQEVLQEIVYTAVFLCCFVVYVFSNKTHSGLTLKYILNVWSEK